MNKDNSKKKNKKTEKQGLIIPKRQPGKVTQTDYLKNLRPFPSQQHPVNDILGLNLDDQNIGNLVVQIPSISDDQEKSNGTTEINLIGQPNNKTLGDQKTNFGRPSKKSLDDKTTKDNVWATKKDIDLVAQTTKKQTLVDQKSKKPIGWKKYEHARSTARIGLRPNAEILKKIKHFCVEQGMDVSEFFEIAALNYIDLVDQNKLSLVDKSPIDERRMMIMFKTESSIINLYLRYNSVFNPNTKWKPRDDEAAQPLNGVSPIIVELGIIQAQINKYQSDPLGTINSFKYYKQEIENFTRLGLDDKTLESILEINRKNWTNITRKSLPK